MDPPLTDSPVLVSSSSHSDSVIFLNLPISTKLNETNFIAWKSQILPLIHGCNLTRFINSPPPSTTRTTTSGQIECNPEYLSWHRQDQLLLGWIRSSLTETMLMQVVLCSTAAELLVSLQQNFISSSRARLINLHQQLQSTSKDTSSYSDYIQQVHQIADDLALVGSPITDEYPAFSRLNRLAMSGKASESNDQMDRELLMACSTGDLNLLEAFIRDKPKKILTSTTPAGNNCLHLAAMLRYHDFAKVVWSKEPSLFSSTNNDGETPLVAALAAANATLASDMIDAAKQLLQPDIMSEMEGGKPLNEMLLKVDIRGDNVLHHAMRNGLDDLAAQLLDIEPRLSEQVNNTRESPMYMAARKGYSKVLERLLSIPSSAECGPLGFPPLHKALQTGKTDIIEKLLEGRPMQAYKTSEYGLAPFGTAVISGNLEIVKLFLKHDPNLAHICGNTESAIDTHPFLVAAINGLVPIAEEISRVCPDAAYAVNRNGSNALHLAIANEQKEFVDYILRTPKLHRLINQADDHGNLPLHEAAYRCNPQQLRSLLNYKGQDHTAVNMFHSNAIKIVSRNTKLTKTLNWNESYTLVSNSIPYAWATPDVNNAKKEIRKQAIEEIKSLTERYISNTSLVAALLATITFAAAFTLPGGYSSDTYNAGLPIFGTKAAFQVFLISDTIAMCSSLAVVFLCVLATWEDLDYLLNYRKTTRVLMSSAYVTTAVAFGTGLYTVIAPTRMWLAIIILVLSCSLPAVSKIIGDWPLLMLHLRLGGLYRKDLIPNI